MKLVVFSHKPLWPSDHSPTGIATDGGFPIQMRALAELFDRLTIVAPCGGPANRPGEQPLAGPQLNVVPLTMPAGVGLRRKIALLGWLFANLPVMIRELRRADAVHAPIPGDIGTIGIALALIAGKPLFVRHCGNWARRRTAAEHVWRWMMESFAGGRRVMLATGGAPHPPSPKNPAVRWIFSTSMTEREMDEVVRPAERTIPTRPRLIIVGRQERGKGTETILRALPLLLDDFPGIALDIVGAGSALPELRLESARLGLNDRVTFHGNVDHRKVMDLLMGADLFCFPTGSEGFPKAVVEAMACGLPVITTKVSVLPRLVAGCGVLLDEVTPEDLAKAIGRCLSDPPQYREMSAQAMSTARQYTLERWRETLRGYLSAAWGELSAKGREG